MPTYALSVGNLSLSYGRKSVLKAVRFDLGEGLFACLVGENGAGKTSLIKILAGLVQSSSGIVRVLSRDPASDPHELRRSIAYLAESVVPPLGWKVEELLRFHASFYPNYSVPHERLLVSEYRIDVEARLASLSAGQMRRVQIAAALACRPRLLLIDEITAVLDILGRQRFYEHLSQLRREQGSTILLGTNLLDNLDPHATDVLILHDGSLLSHLTGKAIRSEGTLAETVAHHLKQADEPHGNVLPFSKTGSER